MILDLKRILTCCVSDKRRQEKVGEGELDGPVEKEEGKRGRERGREAISSRYPPISQMGHLGPPHRTFASRGKGVPNCCHSKCDCGNYLAQGT